MSISVAQLPFRLSYHPDYHLKLGGHVFPSVKFQMIHDQLVAEGLLNEANLIVPEAATRQHLQLVHSAEWVSALLDGTINYDQVLKLEIPYSQPMVRGFLYHVGGSIAVAEAALVDGAAFNIGGGFHHAFKSHGEGFCALNDVAVAIRALQQADKIRTAMVIDTDVHQGNGTAAIFAGDASVFTVSLHQRDNYPYNKALSSLDIELEDRLEDSEYLDILYQALDQAFDQFNPDLIAYVAGSDPYREDKLGGLNLTIAGMMDRDLMVLSEARKRKIPVFVTLAGGYAEKLADTVTLHTNTALALARTMSA